MTRFIVVPQWQGSASSRAMQLVDGAHAIAGDLPRARTTVVEVPLEAGESLDSGVRRLSALQHAARSQLEALGGPGENVITIGGDAGVAATSALHAIGATRASLDPGAVVVWFGAHAGMHDPETSPTGAYESMSARALVDSLVPAPADGPLPGGARLVLAGIRALDDVEQAALDRLGVVVISADDLDALADAVAAASATSVFIHVSLDVLDPAAIAGISSPEPFGPDVAGLTRAIAAVRAVAPLSGAAITGFAPSSPAAAVDDLGAILRIVGALT